MSDDIYSGFSCDTANTNAANLCQYAGCRQPTTNPKFCNLTCCNRENARKQKLRAAEQFKMKEEKYLENPTLCMQCNCVIAYTGAKEGNKFCSHSCAASATNNTRNKSYIQKQKETWRKKYGDKINPNKVYPHIKIKWRICPITGKYYHNISPLTLAYRQSSPYIRTIKKIYYALSQFKFNVYKLSGFFDTTIIKEFGWYYTPTKEKENNPKNVKGVSRDHMYSVSCGFQNKIHPLVIAHPANCRLMQHQENISKKQKCSITLEHLIQNILLWDNEVNYFSGHSKVLELIHSSSIILNNLEDLRKLI